jgi:hypothetical protein
MPSGIDIGNIWKYDTILFLLMLFILCAMEISHQAYTNMPDYMTSIKYEVHRNADTDGAAAAISFPPRASATVLVTSKNFTACHIKYLDTCIEY